MIKYSEINVKRKHTKIAKQTRQDTERAGSEEQGSVESIVANGEDMLYHVHPYPYKHTNRLSGANFGKPLIFNI